MSNSPEYNNDPLSEVSTSIPNWTDRDDVKLIYSMFNLKPVGIHKHFYMCVIVNNFNDLQKSEGLPLVTPDTLWTRLNELYDLKTLEEYEPLPPALTEEIDFDTYVDQQAKASEESDDDKPLAKKILMRSESEESKVSGMEIEIDENNGTKPPKQLRKKSIKPEESVSSEDEPATKSLRSRGRSSNMRKSKSPVIMKKKK